MRFTPRRPIALVALLLVFALAWLLWPVSTLRVRQGYDGPVIRTIPVSEGNRVVYGYTHSVQKGRVDEVLEVRSGRLVVVETIYDMYGAGLPSDVLDGTSSVDPGGKFHILDMSREMPVWPVRVAVTAQQTLEVGGATFRLDSLAPPMTLLMIDVASTPRVFTWILTRTGSTASPPGASWPNPSLAFLR